ncbi:DNase I-like protein [Cantharellus anzutake]|uniref:DNase I-like protein n=1 Tax=Cantharellus anzutake TaxID=1750568 RepID=UPI001907699C|nr:DNase I-like protein [Cantharellus anzutake]KAF8341436.1 DNase I-like protein [Cantharellus anzutake]
MHNANGFLPPPTRVIGAQDALPPARRPPESDGSSSEEEEQEVDGQPYPTPTGPFKKRLEELPDATHSSRRPPHFRPGFEVPLSAHTGAVAVAGNCVCTASHHIRVYDLDTLDSPIYVFDVKDAGLPSPLKDHRVTALAFRPSRDIEDEGRFLWCGTKDGHLFEFDAWSGVFRGARQGVHLGALTHILRYGQSMVTICDQGKALISSALEDGSEFGMTSTSIRSLRLSEKQGFVKIFGNHLWTANGPGNNNAGAATALRGPSLRIYDLTPGNPTPKTLIPSDAVGQVTSGAVIPSRPEYVYIGHEGGCVTIWMRGGERSLEVTPQSDVPVHVGTVKIGTSDVLALEGVRTRLWAGFRNGMILAYDVEPIPWRVTNTWKAHEDCPVLKIDVDPLSIDKCARLTVFSTGRNERVRFWDGLLGVDYVETELLRREARYSLFYDLKILICSWNIDASRPDMLTCNGESVSFLPEVLRSVGDGADAPDIIVFGFQEVIDLESRKLTAKTVLLTSGKKKKEGTLADKVSSQYRLWLDQLSLSIRTAMPLDCPYSVVHFENMVGLLTCVFVKRSERHRIKNSAITTMKRGLGGRYGNKGAIAARFTIDDSSLCFINSKRRPHRILEDKSVFPAIALEEDGFAFVGGGDGSMILDHETCFLSGDLNYRIDQRRENVIASIKAGELDYLLQHDQLSKERKNNPAFRLRSFREAPITFPPTYKYDRRSDEFDTSEKRRVPAWCDRILYRCRDPQRVQYLHYRRYEANISDHRPISGGFHITTRLVQPELRDTEKLIVEQEWRILEQELLREAHRFYLREMRL